MILFFACLKASIGVHISCKSTQLHLAPFQLSGKSMAVGSVHELVSRLSTHYVAQALFRAGLLLGGLELIGNPAGLVAAFAAGVSDLVHFADSTDLTDSSDNDGGQGGVVSREQRLGLLRGLATGLMSLAKHTTGCVLIVLSSLKASNSCMCAFVELTVLNLLIILL